jgi:hypothetical protein
MARKLQSFIKSHFPGREVEDVSFGYFKIFEVHHLSLSLLLSVIFALTYQTILR